MKYYGTASAAAAAAVVAVSIASLSSVVIASACDGQAPGAIICKDLNNYYTCGAYAVNTVTALPPSQKCCNNQLVPVTSTACGASCGNSTNDGSILCTGANTFITCSSQVVSPVSMLCAAGTVCCTNGQGIQGCTFSTSCATGPSGSYAPTSTVPSYVASSSSSAAAASSSSSAAYVASSSSSAAASSSSSAAYVASSSSSVAAASSSSSAAYVASSSSPAASSSSSAVYAPSSTVASPVPTYTGAPYQYGNGAAQCANATDGTVICTSGNTFNICKSGVFAAAYVQTCPAGLTCCSNLGRCDVATCQPPALPNGNCTGIADNKITCTSATTFNICLNSQPASPFSQSCQPGLVCCQGLNRCDVAGCLGTPSYTPASSPPSYSYNPSSPPAPAGNCSGMPDNYVVCTSATTFNICKGGAKPYGDQSCQPGLICCQGSQRCDTTCAANYSPPTPPPAQPPAVYTPPQPGNPCSAKSDGYIVCRSKTTLNSCLNGQLASPNADISCPAGLECCESTQRCDWPGCYTPTYTPPPSCSGVPDNQIVCTDLTHFNICYNGVFAGVGNQACPPTTVCCQNLNRCDVPGCSGIPSVTPPYNPPSLPPVNPNPNPAGCKGKQDNQIICRSATTFNICNDQTYFAPDQSCPSGLVCCDNLNRCDYTGCSGTPSPIPGKTNYNSAPLISNPGGNCTAKPDNYVVCTGVNTLNICSNGLKASKYDQVCPAGLVCCENTQSCEAACPLTPPVVPYTPSCQGQPDGTVLCVGGNTFTLCQGGVATPSQMCPSNLVCCSGKGKCDYVGCNGPAYVPPSPPAPVYTPPAINCTGVPDGHITCTTATTYRICQNGLDASHVDQSCQAGLYCCANSNSCDYAGCPNPTPKYTPPPAPVYNASVCAGVPDGHIYCTGTNTFNMCQGNLPVSSASQTCQPGLVCCAATNRCDVSGCPGSYANTVAYTPVKSGSLVQGLAKVSVDEKVVFFGAAVYNPTTLPTTVNCTGLTNNYVRCASGTTFNFCYAGAPVSTYDQSCPAGLTCCEATQRCEYTCKAAPPSNPQSPAPVYASPKPSCAGQANNYVVCTGSNTFNICNNGGFASAFDQTCPNGQVCCQSTQRCDDPSCPAPSYAPAPYTGPSCAGLPDNHIVCTGSNTFKYCMNNAIYSSADITCPGSLVCCQGLNRCDVAGCPATQPPSYTPATLPSYSAPPPQVAPSCAGKTDGDIVCKSAYTFNTCVNNAFYWAADMSCALGTVCCADSNRCDFAANCKTVLPVSPAYVTPPAPSCANITDGDIVCVSSSQFMKCISGNFVPSAPLTCAPGTVCCADSNRCDFASNCKSQLPALPPVNLVNYIGASNVCAGVPDSQTACVNPATYTVCMNQMPATVAAPCAPGTTCVGGTCFYAPSKPNMCQSALSSMECVSPSQYVLCAAGVATTPSMPCAPGTVCCGNACVFSSDPSCALAPGPVCAPPPSVAPPQYNPPPPVIKPVVSQPCANVADYNMGCTSLTTFNTCLGGKTLSIPDRSCPVGTVCCASKNACTWVDECPTNPYTPLPSICSGLPDNTQICLSSTQFNLCWKGQFTTQIPQSCAPGTVCCADSNKCLPAAQCKAVLPAPYVDPNAALLVPASNIPIDYCKGVPDGSKACVNPQYLAKCKGGVPLQGLSTCPAGKMCSGGACVAPASVQQCSGAPDNTRWCTSDTQFVICKTGAAITAPQSCPANTNCCGNACVAPTHPLCARPASYVAPTSTSTTSAPAPSYTAPPSYAQPYEGGTCTACADNMIRCRSKNSFNFCMKQNFFTTADLFCAEGTVCCADTNQCDFEFNCKVMLPPACHGNANGATICVSGTAYKTCLNGDFAPGITACPAGTACSSVTNTCQPSNGIVQYYPPLLQAPNNTVFPASPVNVCAGMSDGALACLNPSQFTLCEGGMPKQAQSVAPGTQCCGNSMTWPTDPKCGNTCSGVQNNYIACSSAYSYTVCQNGLSITAPSVCPAGNVCCGNACVPSTDPLCAQPGPLYVPPPNPYVPPPANPPAPANYTCPAVPTSPSYVPPKTNPCSNVADNQMVCLSSTTFNTCLNNQLYDASQRSCPDGLVCCAGSSPNVCATPAQCPQVLATSACTNQPNNQMVCVDQTHYQTCMNGFYYLSVAQQCPVGTVCCASSNTCVSAAQCTLTLPPAYNPPAPYVAPAAPANICAGINLGIACVNPSSFAQCVNGQTVYGVQSCAAGTVCSNNACVSPYSANYTNVCANVPDTGIACTCSSQFVTCMNNNVFSAPLNCPAGLACCGNACTYPSDPVCAGVQPVPGKPLTYSAIATSTYSAPATTTTSTATSTTQSSTYAPAPSTTNICAGIPDTGIACVSNTKWVMCMNQTVYSTPEACQAGTLCCKNVCRYTWDAECAAATSAVYVASSSSSTSAVYSSTASSSSSAPYIAPTSSSTSPAAYSSSASSSSASATSSAAYSAASSSSSPASSAVYVSSSSASSTSSSSASSAVYASSSSASSTYAASTTSSYQTSTSSSTAAPAATTLTCTTASDYQSVCTGPTTYKYCVNHQFAPYQVESSCTAGNICCPATGTCALAASCPSYTGSPAVNLFPSGSCQAGVDSMFCTSQAEYTLCTKAGNIYTKMPCAQGTVCCPTSNLCDFAYNCPVLAGLTKGSGLATGTKDCANVPDGGSVCSSDQTSLVTCKSGDVQKTILCGDGISNFCCDSTKACAAAGKCPSVCKGNTGTKGRCKNLSTFVVCNDESIGLTVACPAGNICCGKTNSCVPAADC